MTVNCRPNLAQWAVVHDVAHDHVILLRRSSSDLQSGLNLQASSSCRVGIRCCIDPGCRGRAWIAVDKTKLVKRINWYDIYIPHKRVLSSDVRPV